MKRLLVLILVITVPTLVCVEHVAYSQNLDIGEPRTVRMIYFLPNDRPFQANVVQKMKDEMRNLQTFFAEQMQAHGHGNITFQYETDAKGEPVVHRVDGRYPDSYYVAKNGGYWEELEQKFDMWGHNIYFIVWDNSTGRIAEGVGGTGGGGKSYGNPTVTSGFGFGIAAHELAHAFGLGHDFRDGRYILSYGSGRNRLSACAAEFLAVDPYFNPDVPLEEGPGPTIEIISPPTYPAGSESVTIQLKVSDADGIHQVLLFGAGALIACRGLKGKKEAIVEFEYEGVASRKGYVSLSDAVSHSLGVHAIDTNADVDYIEFQLAEISQHHIHTLEGHTSIVGSLAFSPDSKRIASGGGGIVKLWDVATHRNIATFEGTTLAFSADGRTLATGTFNFDTIKLWDVVTKRNIATLGPIDGAYSLAFSPNGKILASGSRDGMITLWDVARKREIFTVEAYTRLDKWTNTTVLSLAFPPDGKILASGSYDRMIKLWDVATGTNIASIREEGLAPYIYSVAFSPDGKILASGRGNGPGNVKLWDVATKRNIAFFDHILEVYSVAFSPDGRVIASGSRDGMVTLRDVATGAHIAGLPHTSDVWSVAFSPDGMTLASGTGDGAVELWEVGAEPLQQPVDDRDKVTTADVITDPNLAAKVREALGLGANARITKQTLRKLTRLDALNSQIENLSGLEHATNLTYLDLYGNKIRNITPIVELTQLRSLTISANEIRNITSIVRLEHATNLASLSLWGNKIRDVTPIAELTQLESLYLQENLIRDVSPLSGLVNLKTLYLKGNPIQDTSPLARLTKIVNVDIEISKPSPVVHIGVAQRPPMYWVNEKTGTLHRLVGAEVENLLPSVKNATGLVLNPTDNKIYWTEQVGKNRGRVKRANLDGSNVQVLANIKSGVPRSLAVDPMQGKLYWTDSRGRIQRSNLNGKGIRNLIRNLKSPENITIDVTGGKLYWTEEPGRIRRANLNGKSMENIASGLSPVADIAISGNKIYWTEITGENRGKIGRANLNGSNAHTLAMPLNDVLNIAVDTVGRKLYWSDSAGNIRRSNRVGRYIKKVVSGVAPLADFALGSSVEAIAAPSISASLPESTQLQPNYPNPFNPETWIPYQLAESDE